MSVDISFDDDSSSDSDIMATPSRSLSKNETKRAREEPKKKKNTRKPKYRRMDLRSQILHRADTYIGSCVNLPVRDWIFNGESIVLSRFQENAGLLRIFLEIISNAIDNTWRSRDAGIKCSKIDVTLDTETGETSVLNDGDTIFMELHEPDVKNGEDESDRVWNPEFIFGKLLTSDNYDDTVERKTSGRNGYGAKLCNIFSTRFTFESYDPKTKIHYTQTWTNNMKERGEPVIKKKKAKGTKPFTKITWTPDFKRFGMEDGYTQECVHQYKKHIYDCAMITTVPCSFNGEKIHFTNILDYAKLYKTPSNDNEVLRIEYKNSSVVLMRANEFSQISFVNGINTKEGGVHVEKWTEAVFRAIVDKINKANEKKKRPKINISDVKRYFTVFINCFLDKPQFSSQSKTVLVSPVPDVKVKPSVINTLMKWSFLEDIEDIIKLKEFAALKKKENKRGQKINSNIDDANKAGSKKSGECLLVLTEGKSAKTFAIAGMEKGIPFNGKLVKGRDYLGFLPLTGKLLNTCNASVNQITKTAVISDITQGLGLQYGVDYTDKNNFAKLRYGGVVIITDADVDGDHIKALILLIFRTLYPSILKRKDPFVVSMLTPIGRIFLSGKKSHVFYNETLFKKWIKENIHGKKKFKVKYYKGLGTSSTDEIMEIFGRRMVKYTEDEKSSFTFDKIFNKNNSDLRKQWMNTYNEDGLEENKRTLDIQDLSEDQTHSYFLDNVLIKYSFSSCVRSIPSVVDGLKESTRKILYAAFMKNKELKVSQLAGYVAEVSNYQHGEQNLPATIIGMAQAFVGSNNIPYLYRGGQFGSRISNGDDASAGRYLTTRVEDVVKHIFIGEDTQLLKKRIMDGDVVEPEFYVPVIPMIFVNGVNGIGTGWSSTVPCFNPLDLIKTVKRWITLKGVVYNEKGECLLKELTPWYRGFKGEIKKDTKSNRFVTTGIVERKSETSAIVRELPIGMSIDQFRETIGKLKAAKNIINFKNRSNVVDVEFEIKEDRNKLKCDVDNLKLKTYLHTGNMVVYDTDGKIKEFSDVNKVIDRFCTIRYGYYTKRKARLLAVFKAKLLFTENRFRFIKEIIDRKLDIMNTKRSDVIEELEKRGYTRKKIQKTQEEMLAKGTQEEKKEEGGTYDYLLDIQVKFFTQEEVEKLAELIEKIKAEKKALEDTDEYTMWSKELTVLQKKYSSWLAKLDKEDDKLRRKRK